jgi:putative endonuclease
MRQFFVYIMASKSRTLYTGVTNDIRRRVSQHKSLEQPGFTKRYKVTRLVYCETLGSARDAIHREKEIKGWVRKKKIALIEQENPDWRDLAQDW